MVVITVVNGLHKPTHKTGGASPCTVPSGPVSSNWLYNKFKWYIPWNIPNYSILYGISIDLYSDIHFLLYIYIFPNGPFQCWNPWWLGPFWKPWHSYEKFHHITKLVGGFNHLEKYWSMGRIIPYIMENKKCLKPPTSI